MTIVPTTNNFVSQICDICPVRDIALAANAALLPMPIKAIVSICYLVLDGKCMFCSVAHVVFPCSIADWTFPTVTGDIPPPMEGFSFTQISSKQAAVFGGYVPGSGFNAELRLATVSRDSVVSVASIALSPLAQAIFALSL